MFLGSVYGHNLLNYNYKILLQKKLFFTTTRVLREKKPESRIHSSQYIERTHFNKNPSGSRNI